MQQYGRRLVDRIRGRPVRDMTLEQQLDPDAELQLSMEDRANTIPAEVLYRTPRTAVSHRVYVHQSEEVLHVVDNQ